MLTLHAAYARRRMYDVCGGESRNDSPTLSFQLSVEVREGESVSLFRFLQANFLLPRLKKMYVTERVETIRPLFLFNCRLEWEKGETFHFFVASRPICSTAAKEVSLQKKKCP